MKKITVILFILLSILESPSKSQEIEVREGNTLSQIANDYNVTVRSLMDANQLYNADKLEIGQKLKLPDGAINRKHLGHVKHIVSSGENINKIATLYSIKKRDIVEINDLINPDLLYPGQVLFLPKEATKTITSESDFHVVSKGETLYKVSKYYGKSVKDLIEINNIEDPNNLKPGTKLHLKSYKAIIPEGKTSTNNKLVRNGEGEKLTLSIKKNNIDEWRKYGPLEINWSQWEAFEGSLIAPAINNNGKPLLIAVNCNSSRLTWRDPNSNWKKWLTPIKDFEYNLLDQLCENSKEVE